MSCHSFGLMAPNIYEVDLSNEVLNIHFGQGAAKISEVKVGGRKKICQVSRAQGVADSNLAESVIFFRPLLLTSDIFAAP